MQEQLQEALNENLEPFFKAEVVKGLSLCKAELRSHMETEIGPLIGQRVLWIPKRKLR